MNTAAAIAPTVPNRLASVSPPVAYLVSRFPRLTETFILREIIELGRQGRPVLLFPLLSVQQSVSHTETRLLADRVRYTSYLSREVFAANLHYLACSPRKYLKTFFSIVWRNHCSFYMWSRAVALFPKSVCIARKIAVSGAQHIHAHFATHPALTAMIASDLTGIRFSFTVHAHDIFVHKSMLREKIDRARFVIAISEFNKKYLLHNFPGLREEKIHVVHCGIEPDQYARAPRSRSVERTFLQILCVASLEPYKGIEYLIRACARLRRSVPYFRCQIIGEGRERTKLQNLIRRLKLEREVCLAGPRRQDEVTESLRQADLFVLPSVIARDGQMEGIPVALMEAMATGIPVVATKISGIPELVDHGVNGMLVPSGDADALADAMSKLCLRKDLREQFGIRGIEKVSAAFRLSENVRMLNDLFRGEDSDLSEHNNEMLPPRMVESIRQVLLRRSGNGIEETPISLEPLHATVGGRDSHIYRVKANGSYPGLIVKQHRPRQNPERAGFCARREYQTMKRLAKDLDLRSPSFGIPEPCAFFPEWNAILMAECPGENFEKQLRWTSARPGRGVTGSILSGAAACGGWLGNFHEATRQPAREDAEIHDRMERSFLRDLQICVRSGLDEKLASSASEYFAQRCRDAACIRSERTGHHGDFGPHNVFLSPGRTLVIDFEGFRTGHPCEDAADFLVLIDLLPFYHAGASMRRKVRAAFLDGYTRRRPMKAELLNLFELQALAKRMAHNPRLGPAFGLKSRVKRERLLWSYRRHFEFLLT